MVRDLTALAYAAASIALLRLSSALILASKSPRRRQLLRQLGLSFIVIPSHVSELVPDSVTPERHVQRLALRKADAISRRRRSSLVLGADTIVVHRNRTIGKPGSVRDAARILRRLSGETHAVHTGIALTHRASGRRVAAAEVTQVTFGSLTDREIAAYVESGSPMDKAGAYGIQDEQGALFVQRINGDFYTVVGLPLRRLYLTLKQHYPDFLVA